MIKKCAVCGAEFEVATALKVCSPECGRERKRRNLREHRARLKADPERYALARAKDKARYEAHREYHLEYSREYNKAYRRENRERINQHAREYVAAHREEKRLKSRCYYWEHREEILEKMRLARLESKYAQDLEYWRGLIERNEGWRRQ